MSYVTSNELVHVVECDAPSVSRGYVRARCGKPVENVPQAGAPTCATCVRLEAEDAAALKSLVDTCYYCTDQPIDPAHSPYCSRRCATLAESGR